MVTTNPGVIYAGPSARKIAEHGGFSIDDTNVALLVANPSFERLTVRAAVHTTQLAPTILEVFGIWAEEL